MPGIRVSFMSGKQPKRKPRPGVDEYGRNLLHEAAIRGELNSIIEELSKGGSINAQDDNGWTALHFAAQENHPAIVNELLRKGADANIVNAHGNGPLWVALMNARGDLTNVKALLVAGADPDRKNAHGRSPRDVASAMGLT